MTQRTICVDLDGVLAYHSKWQGIDHFGEVLAGAREFLDELRKFARVTIYTCRGCDSLNHIYRYDLRDKIKKWLDENHLMYDSIFIGQGKPSALAYIDDRGVSCRPQDCGRREYENAILAAKGLCNVELSDLDEEYIQRNAK